jgi:hypothetical protein
MSSSRRFACLAAYASSLALAALSPAHAQQKPASPPIACPASIAVNESAAPLPGWSLESGKTRRAFERISVYNRDASGKEYDLAPDDQNQDGKRITQTWDVKAYRTMAVYVRCRYRGTSATLSQELPPPVGSCTFRYVAGSHGEVAAKPEMDCH